MKLTQLEGDFLLLLLIFLLFSYGRSYITPVMAARNAVVDLAEKW
jgi:hypothetical protein